MDPQIFNFFGDFNKKPQFNDWRYSYYGNGRLNIPKFNIDINNDQYSLRYLNRPELSAFANNDSNVDDESTEEKEKGKFNAGKLAGGITDIASGVTSAIADIINNSKSNLIVDRPVNDLSKINSVEDLKNLQYGKTNLDELKGLNTMDYLDPLVKGGKGALAGLKVGGPWGALAGGIIGTGLGAASTITKATTYKRDVTDALNMMGRLQKDYDSDFASALSNLKRDNNKKLGFANSSLLHNGNFAAQGGQLDMANNYDTNIVNSGGTHEQNPYGGVQMGVDSQGTPNYVEEGEVRWKDYIFSNRIQISNDILKQLGLSKKNVKGDNITYADMAKRILKTHEETPNDPISKRSVEKMLSSLAQAQEYQKLAEQAVQYNMSPEEYMQYQQQAQSQQQMEQQAMQQQGGGYNEQQMAQINQLAQQYGVSPDEVMQMMAQEEGGQGMEQPYQDESLYAAYGGYIPFNMAYNNKGPAVRQLALGGYASGNPYGFVNAYDDYLLRRSHIVPAGNYFDYGGDAQTPKYNKRGTYAYDENINRDEQRDSKYMQRAEAIQDILAKQPEKRTDRENKLINTYLGNINSYNQQHGNKTKFKKLTINDINSANFNRWAFDGMWGGWHMLPENDDLYDFPAEPAATTTPEATPKAAETSADNNGNSPWNNGKVTYIEGEPYKTPVEEQVLINAGRYAPLFGNALASALLEKDFTFANDIDRLYKPLSYRPVGMYQGYRPYNAFEALNNLTTSRNAAVNRYRNNAGGNAALANLYQHVADDSYNRGIGSMIREASDYNDRVRNAAIAQRNQLDAQNESRRSAIEAANYSNWITIKEAAAKAREEERLAYEQAKSQLFEDSFNMLNSIATERDRMERINRNPALAYTVNFDPKQQGGYYYANENGQLIPINPYAGNQNAYGGGLDIINRMPTSKDIWKNMNVSINENEDGTNTIKFI